MNANELWGNVTHPPKEALSPIQGGRLSGKSNINPQWKIKAMTERYGLCGTGWKYEEIKEERQIIPSEKTGEVMLFMKVAVYTNDGNRWSDPVYGWGGDFIFTKERNGIYANDEAFKMCLTDALGNALKNLGVASAIYEGQFDTKYNRYKEKPKNKSIKPPYMFVEEKLKEKGVTDCNEFVEVVSDGQIMDIKELTRDQCMDIYKDPNKYIGKYKNYTSQLPLQVDRESGEVQV